MFWIVGIAAFFVSLALTPLARWFGFRTGRVSQPRQDRWHRQPTPATGGIAMFIAAALVVGGSMLVQPIQIHWSILLGSALAFTLGVYDDYKRIRPTTKLLGQIVAATVVIFFGDYSIRFFPWPVANLLLTFLWLVGITNAINLLDNMDGLAGGVALIAALFLGYFSIRAGDTGTLLMVSALGGAILGFLVFNFPPARIFMGDSGSMFLGFTLAALAVARRTQASNVLAVLGVPAMLFLLPILETVLMMLTRLLRGQSPFLGGTDHTSHRLIAFGLTERQAVVALYGAAALAGIAGVALESLNYELSLILVPLVVVILSLFAAYLARLKVVSSDNMHVNSVARLISDLTYRRRIFEILLDLMLVGINFYLAIWTSAGLDLTVEGRQFFLGAWPVALGSAYLAFYVFGVYRSVWGYLGLVDVGRYALAALSSALLTALIILLLPASASQQVYLLFGIYLFLALVSSRASFLVLDRLYNRQRLRNDRDEPVILYGVGEMGEIALTWLERARNKHYRILGFIDEDDRLWGRTIFGVPVLGGTSRLKSLIAEHKVSGLILTRPNDLELAAGQEILVACKQAGVWVRILHLQLELVA